MLGGFELLIPRWLDAPPFLGAFDTPLDLSFTIEPVIFQGKHLAILAAVPAVIAGLAWFLLRTDAGVAVRAAAENADRALLLGIPIRRLSTILWMVAGGLATLTFILKAPFAGHGVGRAERSQPPAARRWPRRWWPAWSRCRSPSPRAWDWASSSRSCCGTTRRRRSTWPSSPSSSWPCSPGATG